MTDTPLERRETAGRRASDLDAAAFAEVALGAVKALTDAVGHLETTIGSLATKEEVRESEERQDRRRRLSIAGVVALVVLLVIPVIGQYVTLQEVRDIAVSNEANGNVLVECTTPGNPNSPVLEDRVHECFDRSQDQTADAIALISLALLDAATCARTSAETSEIASCYADRIEARTGTRPPVTTP